MHLATCKASSAWRPSHSELRRVYGLKGGLLPSTIRLRATRQYGKEAYLGRIKRTAKENGGQPLGRNRFWDATGIKESDWKGKYWENFGDAQEEAGFPRNSKQGAYDEVLLIEKFISLIRELKRFPTMAALR